MSQVCRQCSRINPADAAYCYNDGAVLSGHASSGPINAGSAPFPSQFIFPTGLVCKNFDQLALACQQNWQHAVDVLRQGFLGTFFGGLGRADLAMAAMEAAKFPDIDRGLDQLLSKLPTQVLQNPQLKAEPAEVNLGQVPIGADRNSEIHLHNHGMRLLYGSVVADCKWLTLGDGPGAGQKLFQFGAETVIPVHIKGQHLRAGTKPLEGHLIVESNGGAATITFRADVPIKPFAGGIFDGAKTPRQIAEKAKANPKDAAPHFESGAVAKWFESNGWTYPVQGPSASGLGGVQQFFEALGLAKAPKVVLGTQSLSLRGDGGQTLGATLEVSTPEKKPVYAYATCDQPWVDCSKVKLTGRTATITVAIPRVPNRAGETLQANIKVMGNGNQKFTVPLSLTIDRADPSPAPEPGHAPPQPPPLPFPIPVPVPVPMPAQGVEAFADMITAMPAPAQVLPDAVGATPPPLLVRTASSGSLVLPPVQVRAGARKPLWMHLTPLALLLAALVGVLFYDWLGPVTGGGSGGTDAIDKTQRLGIFFDYGVKPEKGINNTMTFGLVMVDPAAPRQIDKKLTFDHRGRTNSTVLMIDGQERAFGYQQAGKWEDAPKPKGDYGGGGRAATFKFTQEQVLATQLVEIVPGEGMEGSTGALTRHLDTCLVRYTLKNIDKKTHKVGLRVLLDTLIGANDGCPFTIPGTAKLVSTFEDFHPTNPQNKKSIPDFVQALEFEDLRKPGTIALVNLKVGGKLEPPGRVSLTQWPGGGEQLRRYEVPIANIGNDSAVVMYWHPADLEPGKTRELGFSYGLGNLSAQSEKIALTFGGSFVVRGELSVVALIADPQKGQTAELKLPPGAFALLDSPVSQAVPPSTEKGPDGNFRPSPVTWRLRSEQDGPFTITVKTSNGLEASRKITIKKSSIF